MSPMSPGEQPRVPRRRILQAGAATAGGLWVLPSVVSLDVVAAASVLATVTAGDPVQRSGGSAQPVPMPSGTFSRYVLVLAIVANNSGSDPSASVPAVSGWTTVTSLVNADPPSFAIYTSTSPSAPTIPDLNLSNGRWAAVVLGFTTGTTVYASAVASGGSATQSFTLGSTPVTPTGATWVFAGSASNGLATNNWAPLPSPTWSTVVSDVGGAANTPPDLYAARYNTLTTSLPGFSQTYFQTGSGGTNYGGKGVLVGVA